MTVPPYQDDVKNNQRTNYFNSPALDVSVVFRKQRRLLLFLPAIDDLLTPEEQAIRLRVRECMEKDVAPIMAEYWDKAEFPFQIIPKLGALRIAGETIKGYGCPGLSIMANAFATAEIARVDASCSAFFLVHSSLAMLTSALCGSEAQKQKYLPSLAEFKTVACWGLTEPDYGSVASALRATATKVLAVSRVMVAWQPIGLCMGVYDMCHRYLKERKQFGAPLAAFQINQEKLVPMLGNVQAMVLIGWRLWKLYEAGKMTPGYASMGKSWITLRARETVALGRELLSGNGILSEFLVAKAFGDLEPIYTFEGTYDINALVTGREVTGIASFRPAALTQRSCL
ncbi:hypothetical protein DVH24_036198 [Malus domestica]|uniref:Acyl-CoA dehydrogenase/oxidase C-terminal domain-containing protein n=1 Tax=Malus domestica TaxID=3750 RepID=A0A498IIJ7_MALDO|nr:hypothetical protein DVH24_036198 [Malus domestica]